jgi:hypothetical protein
MLNGRGIANRPRISPFSRKYQSQPQLIWHRVTKRTRRNGRQRHRYGRRLLWLLPPIWGAVGQEVIDLIAVLNAVRVALPTEDLQDF